MPTREEFEETNRLIEEAIAMCVEALVQFDRINEEMQTLIRKGHALTQRVLTEEERASEQLFLARARLSRRRPSRVSRLSVVRSQT
jgi:hypothetical protein